MPNYNKKINDTSMRLGLVRFSFVHVFEPHAVEEDDPKKYSIQILIPKDDKVALKMIDEAVKAAIQVGKTTKWNGKIPPEAKLKLPLRDGDAEYPEKEEYNGMYFLNASSDPKFKPGVCVLEGGRMRDALDDGQDVYSGCWGCVSIGMFPFNGKQDGIAVGLNNVIKVQDGDKLGGSSRSAEADFDDLCSGDDESWAN